MERLATLHWRTPEPTSIDEELALFDDDSAWLVVRGPRNLGSLIGTFRAEPAAADLGVLRGAGREAVEFDLLRPPADEVRATLMAVADRVSASAREAPEAVAKFHVQALGRRPDGLLALSLLVVGTGTRPVQFELDPSASSVLFSRDGESQGWCDLPDLPAGFASRDAEELGGVGRRAVVKPGSYGAIAFEVPAPPRVGAVAIRVGGRLSEALPDDSQPARFRVTTDDVPVDG